MNSKAAGLSLSDGLDLSGMTLRQVWLRYIGIGGCEGLTEVEKQLSGRTVLTSYEHNLLAQAINEHFIELDQDHPVAYDGSHVKS